MTTICQPNRARTSSLAAIIGIGFLLGCGPHIRVATVVDPDARFDRLHTFTILPTPDRRDRRRPRDDDPMLVNSASYRAVRESIRDELEALGYREADREADFSIAYYASARERLDVTLWNYGYRWSPRWWHGWGRGFTTATEYVEGTVIIDVVDPSAEDPIWRGRGVVRTSDNPREYREDLRRTVAAILEKFPPASRHVVGRERAR
jgi:hypothetical protein